MKIAVLSDTRLPTSPDYPGHGLGQIVYAVASGLAEKGHSVTLFAGYGSTFPQGELKTASEERDFLQIDLTRFDAIIDNTHDHVTGAVQSLPAIQVSHDREHKPTANAVFPGSYHRNWHGFNEQNGKIVHNGVKVPDISGWGERRGGYVAYLGTFYAAKQPLAAIEAARLAGVKLLMAGTTPPAPPPGGVYIGPVSGQDKLDILYHADALLFTSSVECAPVTVLEAQAVGTPVVVSSCGGSSENMEQMATGWAASDIEGFSEAIRTIGSIDRDYCIKWVQQNRSEQAMINEYDALINRVANGERW